MSWLDADDDDEEDDDYQLLEGVSEGWRRGPMVPPRRVFKVGDLAPALSPVQVGLGSDLSPEAGLQSPTRPKAKPFRDNDKSTQERDNMYDVEELRDFLFPRIQQFHTISNLFYDLSINQIQDSQLQPDLGVKMAFFMIQGKRCFFQKEVLQQHTHVQKKSKNAQGEALSTNPFIPNCLKNCQKINFLLTGAREMVGYLVEIKKRKLVG
ncbi:uncharacterized protein LOC125451689 isoform X3 [Stegostoma tigrinum]|uniref:uncharacterized protein LOC125451689 isoform X3 n=1 Tax=Stegostoma tigrinum TaxID=3053191 RepID=UPI0028701AAC|nr:uncharacterized protein LOC125451689 isoform X3 [Stegostoma tigrinum]